ncbi:hypothetical protein BH11ACT3_BH11ACT3_08040 [soil metagenome]
MHTSGVVVGIAILSTFALSSCSAPEPAPTATPVSIRAEDTCEQFADVMTLMFNMAGAHRDGRISDQELLGATQLAARILSHVQVEPETDLATAIADAQAALTVNTTVPIDEFAPPTDWNDARSTVADLCQQVDPDFGIAGWTGG